MRAILDIEDYFNEQASQIWTRAQGNNGWTRVLSGSATLFLAASTALFLRQGNYWAVAIIILSFVPGLSRFGCFASIALLIWVIIAKSWVLVFCLAAYTVISWLAGTLAIAKIKRSLLEGVPIINPFEGAMGIDLSFIALHILCFAAIVLTGWLSTTHWVVLVFVAMFLLGYADHRLRPKWKRVHCALMSRYASFAGMESGISRRERREYDPIIPVAALIGSVYPQLSKESAEAKTKIIYEQMIGYDVEGHWFKDRHILFCTFEIANPNINESKVNDILDRVHGVIQAHPEGCLVRWAIADVVDGVFGEFEKAKYLWAVIKHQAS